MKKKYFFLSLLALSVLAVPALAYETVGQVTNPRGDSYDLIKIEGTVEERQTMPNAVEVRATDGNEYEVKLGPAWYKDIDVKEGDYISATGVLHQDGDEKEIAAFTLTQADGTTVTLREKLGRPAWAGKGGRHGLGSDESEQFGGYGNRGQGRMNFVDNDGDGVCDYMQAR